MSLPFRARVPVIWLASYPRSGNTLLRVILKHCFSQTSQSIYDDRELCAPQLHGLVGHEPVDGDPLRFVARARSEGRKLFVKTHELPPAQPQPAIYIVRDGRSAVVSHAHYLRDILQKEVSLADVIAGKLGLSWSQHVKAWILPRRAATLVVRYEDLAAGNPQTLAEISGFIGQPQLQPFDIRFDRLHTLNPAFFRKGSDAANISELDAASAALFDQLHGDILRALGYGRMRARPAMA